MLAVIVAMAPFTVPKLFGYRIYGVLTESMTPAYSVGSVVYIRTCEPEEIRVGDVITFQMGTDTEYVMTHRVVEIDSEAAAFITKGDANDAADPEPVAFRRLIGKAVLCIPGLAGLSDLIDSTTGKALIFIVFALAFILWVIADMLAPARKRGKKREELRETAGEQEKPAKSHGRGRAMGILLRILGTVLIAGAVVYLCSIFLQYRKGSAEYDALQELVFGEIQTEENGSGEDGRDLAEGMAPEADTPGENEETADRTAIREADQKILAAIRGLKEQNADVIGWIAFDNMDLSYPIMQGEDDSYYLTHTFSGETNSAGSIFMEAGNSPDFQDCHTIIYGHNMKNLSMFGQLRKFRTEEFYQENQYFTVYTQDQVYRYQIFACYDISESGDIYTIGFAPDEEFGAFVDEMKRRSYYDTGVEATKQDKIITLSTCSATGKRFVINAKRVEDNREGSREDSR